MEERTKTKKLRKEIKIIRECILKYAANYKYVLAKIEKELEEE